VDFCADLYRKTTIYGLLRTFGSWRVAIPPKKRPGGLPGRKILW
jgi:hypothetical protein